MGEAKNRDLYGSHGPNSSGGGRILTDVLPWSEVTVGTSLGRVVMRSIIDCLEDGDTN